MGETRQTIAVIFGGRSVEHDVSVLTGIQFLEALDQTRYVGLPVYVDPQGQWWTGEALRKRSLYPVDDPAQAALQPVTLPVGVPAGHRPALLAPRKGMLRDRIEEIAFDLAVPAIHGSNGEDGSLQGLLAFAGIPYAGCRPLGAAATMDKRFTKQALDGHEVPLLPELALDRPANGQFLGHDKLLPRLEQALGVDPFPVIVKPRRLGSSAGVMPARDMESLQAGLATAFRLDSAALIEPLIEPLVEYNVAVRRDAKGIVTSAIERPLSEAGLLDFESKYLAGGAPAGPKLDAPASEGMASANRVLDPEELTDAQETLIRESAAKAFALFDLAGSVRVDFLCNAETGELWLNEINTIPGSFAFFLWQAAAEPLGYTALATVMVEEGFSLSRTEMRDTGSNAAGAQIFRRG
mgnify:CR=1 FL=1